jgi:hypothetical protein
MKQKLSFTKSLLENMEYTAKMDLGHYIRSDLVINKKWLYLLLTLFAFTLVINFYQYKENEILKTKLGYDFQRLARDAFFELEGGHSEVWVEISHEEDGRISLESYIGDLNQLSYQFDIAGNKMSVIGMQIDFLKNEYYDLADNLEEGENIEQNKGQIDRIIDFLVPLLNEIDSISGENEKRWYREFTDEDSRTQKLVWDHFKQYEKQNQ